MRRFRRSLRQSLHGVPESFPAKATETPSHSRSNGTTGVLEPQLSQSISPAQGIPQASERYISQTENWRPAEPQPYQTQPIPQYYKFIEPHQHQALPSPQQYGYPEPQSLHHAQSVPQAYGYVEPQPYHPHQASQNEAILEVPLEHNCIVAELPSNINPLINSEPTGEAFDDDEILGFEDPGLPETGKVQLEVGSGTDMIVFQLDGSLLSEHSFRFLCHFNHRPKLNCFIVPNWEAKTFQLFAKYISEPIYPTPFFHEEYEVEEPWATSYLDGCILANQLHAHWFERFMLSVFIKNASMAIPTSPWRAIERQAPPQSPIRRFSNHWIAWDSYLGGGTMLLYEGLQAADLTSEVTPTTRDPRIFDLDHWFSPCGDSINGKCYHDPVEVERALNAQQVPKPASPKLRPSAQQMEEWKTKETQPRPSTPSDTWLTSDESESDSD